MKERKKGKRRMNEIGVIFFFFFLFLFWKEKGKKKEKALQNAKPF